MHHRVSTKRGPWSVGLPAGYVPRRWISRAEAIRLYGRPPFASQENDVEKQLNQLSERLARLADGPEDEQDLHDQLSAISLETKAMADRVFPEPPTPKSDGAKSAFEEAVNLRAEAVESYDPKRELLGTLYDLGQEHSKRAVRLLSLRAHLRVTQTSIPDEAVEALRMLVVHGFRSLD